MKNNAKKIYAFTLILFVSIMLPAALSAGTITGTVRGDAGGEGLEPLSGVTIKLKNAKKVAFTDEKGRFEIETGSGKDIMTVSMIGFKKKTIDIEPGTSELDIVLAGDENIRAETINVVEQQQSALNHSDLHATTELTKQSLRKAACCNLSESFETTAAVDVSYSDAVSGAKQIEMLGLKGTYVQMLTDKTPNLRGLAAPFGLTYIPGNWLNSISVSKGASSVSTGHESITGQINTNYKKPHDSEKFFANFFTNSLGELDLNVNTKFNAFAGFESELYFQTNHNPFEIDDNGDGFLDKVINHKYNFMNRWFNHHGDKRRTMFGFQIIDDSRTGGQLDYLDDKDNPELYGMEFDTRRFELFGKQAFLFDSEKAYRSFAVIASGTYHDQQAIFGHRNYDAQQTTAYMNALLNYSTKDDKHFIETGMSAEYDMTEQKLDDPDFGDSFNRNPEYFVPGAFFEYTFSPLTDVRVITGLRADYDMQINEEFDYEDRLFLSPRVHAKWEFWPGWHLRGSAGRGWRHAYPLAENTAVLASSRKMVFDNQIKAEDAWNYGINVIGDFKLFGRPAHFGVEFFRTDFTDRLVTDLDASTGEVHFYNLIGESFSNSWQADFTFRPFKRFVVTSAYRYNDVKVTYDGRLQRKPLSSPHRGFVNLEYRTDFSEWAFDFTANYIGGGRLPDMQNAPEEYRLPETFDPYMMLSAQITRNIGDFGIFIGVENIADYTQDSPIIAADNPYGKHFDSSIIYAPIIGRRFYLKINYELW